MKIIRVTLIFILSGLAISLNAQTMKDSVVYKDSLTSVKGDTISITFVDNPSTGYSWKFIEDAASKKVKYLGDEYKAPETNLIGGAGTRAFKFYAKKKGVVSLKFVKQRGDQAPIEQTWYKVEILKQSSTD
jgi:predicted secreted protein